MWDIFTDKLNQAVVECSFYKNIKCNRSKPWIDEGISKLIRHKKSLWQKYSRSKLQSDYTRHREFSNSLTKILAAAKASFEKQLVNSKNTKKLYSYLRSSLNSKVSTPTVRKTDGTLCADHSSSAEVLADTFFSDVSNVATGTLPLINSPRSNVSLTEITFTTNDVLQCIADLNISTSPGRDGITAAILIKCSQSLATPLSLILTSSFQSHYLPSCWKQAVVTPVFKKGDKHDAKNYRPISLTPLVAKLVEKIITSKLLHFSLSNNLFNSNQHGFLPGRSIITNLLNCVNDWTKLSDDGIPTDVVYIDFSRAFDKVPHEKLLFKLDHLGIRGNLLSWIRAFLHNREFVVRVSDSLSSPRQVLSGVPQGSVLGPILFLLYSSDLPCSLLSTCSSYADDTKIYNTPLNNAHIIQADIDRLVVWSKDWSIPLNSSKCCVLHMGRNNPMHDYVIDGQTLPSSTDHCDLGVTMSNSLSWSEHIHHICSKAKRLVYLLEKSFHGCDPTVASFLYKTYVRPIIEFAGPVWYPVLQRDRDLLESLQRRCTRVPYGARRPAYEDRLHIFNLQPFGERRTRGDLIITYRALHGLFGVDLSSLFRLNINNLRGHNFKLKKEPFKTSTRQHFLSNRVFDQWNQLPADVVNSPSVNSFKIRYDNWCSVHT
ncbi:unnamed protein product [Callosobruchus maculatus]|uniref:Reverse transcriptase domain-containing protein n=1 Tax=Callosobruchus maculatus TaxID=64391 RepID=A0A653CAK4_CALMS|nr:unnamed protein product [Callosobruchus maculatus]